MRTQPIRPHARGRRHGGGADAPQHRHDRDGGDGRRRLPALPLGSDRADPPAEGPVFVPAAVPVAAS